MQCVSGPTNTTALIGAWSMDGAQGDLDGFRSVLDINALVAERSATPDEAPAPVPERPPLLMKPAGEDDWRPLPVALPG